MKMEESDEIPWVKMVFSDEGELKLADFTIDTIDSVDDDTLGYFESSPKRLTSKGV